MQMAVLPAKYSAHGPVERSRSNRGTGHDLSWSNELSVPPAPAGGKMPDWREALSVSAPPDARVESIAAVIKSVPR
jgi:hypothetical protein